MHFSNSFHFVQTFTGCGENGDQIFASYSAFNRNTVGRELVREWAKYRYGIFDEIGYPNDPIYPMCYKTETVQVNGCSDWKINDNGYVSELNVLLALKVTIFMIKLSLDRPYVPTSR